MRPWSRLRARYFLHDRQLSGKIDAVSYTHLVPLGALLGRYYDRWSERRGDSAEDTEQRKRLGVLMATGLIVGESLFGVVFAGIVAASGSDSPLALVGAGFAGWAETLGVVLFLAITAGVYRWTRRYADRG